MSGQELDGVPRAIDLHPEQRDPLVRIRLNTRNVGGAAGWLELKPYLHAWLFAGAAWVELDGDRIDPARVLEVDDYRDLAGARLVIVDETLAGDALAVFRDTDHP